MPISKHAVVALSAMAILLAPMPTDAKNIERSCQSHYEVVLHRADKPQYQGKSYAFGSFTTRRGCGESVPNRCRKRARESAQTCMREHASRIRLDQKPGLCQARHRPAVLNYKVNRLDWEMATLACCKASGAKKLTLKLRGVTKGDKGCPGVLNFPETYPLNCSALLEKISCPGG